MIKKLLFFGSAVVGLFSLALVVAAQGPGPGGGFGHRGPGGPGGPEGLGGRRSAKCSPSCPQYQFTFTRTTIQPVLLANGPSTVKNVTMGTIAGDMYGSTYRDVTFTPVGPWAAQAGPQESIFVHDLDPGVLMNYIENVTKGTYEQFAIKEHTPPAGGGPNPNWKGKAGDGKGPWGNRPAPTKLSYSLADGTYTCAEAEKTTVNHGANSSSTRIFCPALHLVLEEDRTDPRFGSSTYTLSQYTALSVFPFTPKGKLVTGRKFGHGDGPDGNHHRQPPPPLG